LTFELFDEGNGGAVIFGYDCFFGFDGRHPMIRFKKVMVVERFRQICCPT
jgi:hypothetical protein